MSVGYDSFRFHGGRPSKALLFFLKQEQLEEVPMMLAHVQHEAVLTNEGPTTLVA